MFIYRFPSLPQPYRMKGNLHNHLSRNKYLTGPGEIMDLLCLITTDVRDGGIIGYHTLSDRIGDKTVLAPL